eukprot:CAMPEP_0115044004 /NCGR_PEP_ID=MMETSP0216-20121206/47206_1 /TAXON_ID=223996 /ORGANISM="Protocruzia adherens, Strain Boccale" /LENGTH=196 /DNA_ID=CAMNT_0002426433 /DNA_START=124 /DNA_END=710 /DNA_ORIENTATION=+
MLIELVLTLSFIRYRLATARFKASNRFIDFLEEQNLIFSSLQCYWEVRRHYRSIRALELHLPESKPAVILEGNLVEQEAGGSELVSAVVNNVANSDQQGVNGINFQQGANSINYRQGSNGINNQQSDEIQTGLNPNGMSPVNGQNFSDETSGKRDYSYFGVEKGARLDQERGEDLQGQSPELNREKDPTEEKLKWG